MGMRRGVVLIVAMWIAAFLSLVLYLAMFQTKVNTQLTNHLESESIAKNSALSGIDYCVTMLLADAKVYSTTTDTWYNSESAFKKQTVGGGYFSVIKPDPNGDDTTGGMLYGIQDENALADLNYANTTVLGMVPSFDTTTAQKISDYVKNTKLETVESAMVIQEVTPDMMFGDDRNRNGTLDTLEDLNTNGTLDRGAFEYCTVWSHDRNVANDGRKRINLNSASEQEMAQFFGNTLSQNQIRMIVNRRNQKKYDAPGELLTVPSISRNDVKKVIDLVSVTDDEDLTAMLNVNTVPDRMLRKLNMPQSTVEKAIEYRKNPNADLSTIGWLLDVLDDATFISVSGSLTTRSLSYRIDVVGWVAPPSDTSTNYPKVIKRYLAVVKMDKWSKKAKIVFVKDISQLGVPYNVWE